MMAGFILILAGLAASIFRRPLARFTVAAQNATWGFRWGNRTIRLAELSYLSIGGITIAFGILTLVGVVR